MIVMVNHKLGFNMAVGGRAYSESFGKGCMAKSVHWLWDTVRQLHCHLC